MRRLTTRRRPYAFTLVELVIVILILGILAGVAAPKLFQVTAEGEASSILTNINTIFDAAQIFYAQSGKLPGNANSGQFPTDFQGLLPERLFTQPGPFGSYYDWNGPGTSIKNFGVSIDVVGGASPETRDAYQAMEALVDDGSPSGGWITIEKRRIIFELASKSSLPAVGSGDALSGTN